MQEKRKQKAKRSILAEKEVKIDMAYKIKKAKAKEQKKFIITRTDVHKSSVGSKKGWAFSIYWENRDYPNFVSALYKTKKEANLNLNRYIKTGKFDYYGSAE